MRMLKEAGHPVLPLGEAVQRLEEGTLPDNAVVVTLDDGFKSVRTIGAPILAEEQLPSTLYATTYYILKGTPIYGLVVQYMFWKADKRTVDIDCPQAGISGRFDLTRADLVQSLCQDLIRIGEERLSEPERQIVLRQLGKSLGVDYNRIAASEMFTLMSPEQLAELQRLGMSVELHTHRHRFPADDQAQVQRELQENADYLQQWLKVRPTHFCYPSGQWAGEHLAWLESFGIASATTCDSGLNTRRTHPLALYRMVDLETVSELEFEAELAGFSELLRILVGRRWRSDRRRAGAVSTAGSALDVSQAA
jgi:peptidoglycan/xylan/chitin deacetylase (PgdA/CDA1 family)